MNVYYIDPTNVKPEGWSPLLKFLKVKSSYSFLPIEEIPNELYDVIKPSLKASYSNQDLKKFADNAAFWLRAHFEKHIHLITDDYETVASIPKEELRKYSSSSAYNNIINLDDANCLVLMKLKSSFDVTGEITAPQCYVSTLFDSNLPTHLTRYCLNILHKKYGHNQYQNQSAFIVFDEYFANAYQFVPRCQDWKRYSLRLKSGGMANFMKAVNKGVREKAPDDFPIINVEGKKRFTLIRTDEADMMYKKLIADADEAAKAYEEEQSQRGYGEDWQNEVDELNRAFWNECGEGGSNCESWPGWD